MLSKSDNKYLLLAPSSNKHNNCLPVAKIAKPLLNVEFIN